MHKIGVFSYKCRYVILGVFVIFFMGMIFAKGNTDIAYTMSEENAIDSVFPENNSIVLLYYNSDESAAKMLAEDLEKEESVVSVMSYGNTIGKDYTVGEMANVVGDMGSDITIDDTMLGLVYYEYHSESGVRNLTLSEFVSFLQEHIMQDEMLSEFMDEESKSQIDMLALFARTDELSKNVPVRN